MTQINHVDNFGTNLTSNVNAGDTTSPLNSIPSIAAPFYLAFDATNANGHYEVRQITSKTATNVNHAALSYAHTTAEEVRCVLPSVELDLYSYGKIGISAPEGFLINGKIVPSVASNNLTVAIKTLAGTDASATDPIYVRIGDTVRTITAALSVTMNAGINWFNAGSAELATKEIDYFVYLLYGGTPASVVMGISRIPSYNIWSEVTDSNTSEKNWEYSTNASSLAASDPMVNIGRFAATLSAGAGYTWTVPTFTAANLIQRPIYKTRVLSWQGVFSGSTSNQTGIFEYIVDMNQCMIRHERSNNPTSNSTSYSMTLPFTAATVAGMIWKGVGGFANNGSTPATLGSIAIPSGSASANFYTDFNSGAWAASNIKGINIQETKYSI